MLSNAAILFDLDGTLVDSAPDLIRVTNEVLARSGLPPAPEPSIRKRITSGARRMLEGGMEAVGADPARHDLDALTQDFLDIYAADAVRLTRPFPGTGEMLTALARAHARLAVCTNKRVELSHMVLKALDLQRHFVAVLGGDSVGRRKPHPDHLYDTLRAMGGAANQAVMVGDSATDIDAARAAGIPSIAVSFGYSAVPVAELGADRVIDRMDQVPDAVVALLAAV